MSLKRNLSINGGGVVPFKAIDVRTNQIIYAWQVKVKRKFICPYCRKSMIFVDSIKKRKHFRHKTSCDYYWESETLEHEEMKYIVYSWLKELFPDKVVDVEVKIGSYIADVVVKDEKRFYVFECQKENTNVDKILKKCMFYSWKGFPQIWISFCDKKTLEKLWKNRPYFTLNNEWMRYIYYMSGQAVFLDTKTEKFGVYNLEKRISKTRFKVNNVSWQKVFNFTIYVNEDNGFILLKEKEKNI